MRRISRVSRNAASDLGRKKQVKFADPVDDHEPNFKHNTSLVQIDGALTSNYKEGKTSEYKSFIKLREERRHKVHNHLPVVATNIVEGLNTTQSKYNKSIPFVRIPKAASFVQKSSLSPTEVSENCELNRQVICNYGMSWSQSPIQQITPIAQESISHLKASQNYGPKYMQGGIFSKKRENILQVAAKASSVEVDDITSKRADFISGFLERLDGSRTRSSKFDVLPGSGHKKLNDIDLSLASSQRDGFRVQSHETTGAHFSGTAEKHSGRNLLCYGYDQADELVTLPVGYVAAHAFPTCNDPEVSLRCKRRKYQSTIDDGVIPNLPAVDMIAENDVFESTVKKPFGKRFLTYSSNEADCDIVSSSGHLEDKFPTGRPENLWNKRKHEWMPDKLALTHWTKGTGVFETNATNHVRNDSRAYRFTEDDDLDVFETNATNHVRNDSRTYRFTEDDDLDAFETNATNHVRNDSRIYRFAEDDDLDVSSIDYIEDRSALALELKHARNDLRTYRFREADDDLLASLLDFGEDKLPLALEWHGTNRTDFSEHSYRVGEADHLVSSSTNNAEAQLFPSLCHIGNDRQCRIEDFCSEDKSALPIEWNTKSGCDEYGHHRSSCMITESDGFTPDDELFAPFHHLTSINIGDFDGDRLSQSSEELSNLWLLESSVRDRMNSELSCLPMTLYAASDFRDRTKSCTIKSPPANSVFALPDALPDAFYGERDSDSMTGSELTFARNWDGRLMTSSDGCELVSKRLPIDSDADYSEFQFHGMMINTSDEGFLGEPRIMENEFLGDTSGGANFESFGRGYSDSEKGIFALMPDRVSWY